MAGQNVDLQTVVAEDCCAEAELGCAWTLCDPNLCAENWCSQTHQRCAGTVHNLYEQKLWLEDCCAQAS